MNINNTALILIDMQEFFLRNLKQDVREKLIENQIEIIDFCIKNKIPVFITQYNCLGIFRGKTIPVLLNKIGGNLVRTIVKLNNSAFTKTELDSYLKELKIKKLLIMGVNGNGCVQDTTISALKRGYEVIIPNGTIASVGRKDLDFSKRNKIWYEKNTKFFNNKQKLVKYLSLN
jgi:nicotinamidase-related amidase